MPELYITAARHERRSPSSLPPAAAGGTERAPHHRRLPDSCRPSFTVSCPRHPPTAAPPKLHTPTPAMLLDFIASVDHHELRACTFEAPCRCMPPCELLVIMSLTHCSHEVLKHESTRGRHQRTEESREREEQKMICGLHRGQNSPFTHPLSRQCLVYLVGCVAYQAKHSQCAGDKIHFEDVLGTT
jgi:hypothetical protein